MRRRSYPKPGDRICLALPPTPRRPEVRERVGTVVERSRGRSRALLVRWDTGSGPEVETWLADAAWHWERSHLLVVGGKRPSRVRGAATPTAVAETMTVPEDGDRGWLEETVPVRPGFPRPAPAAGMRDAAAEWDAALDDVLPDDAHWDEMLAAATGTPAVATPRASRATPASKRFSSARTLTPGRTPAHARAGEDPDRRPSAVTTEVPPVPVPSRAEPVATPAPPSSSAERGPRRVEPDHEGKGWTGDDILPGRGAKRRDRR